VKNEWVTPVSCDNSEAGRAIADLFAARGARSFGFISGPVESHASAGRLAGYRDRLGTLGIGPVTVARGDYRYEGGFAAALELFGCDQSPDALFCANDLLAIGAIDALRKKFGMRVPEDVIVAGFDDIPAAAWASIDLTTFVQDGARMVDAALAIVSSAQVHERQELAPVVVSARLIERGTTRLLRSG
jgi:DNA-binding LacI/PurR family transcriptional regulator